VLIYCSSSAVHFGCDLVYIHSFFQCHRTSIILEMAHVTAAVSCVCLVANVQPRGLLLWLLSCDGKMFRWVVGERRYQSSVSFVAGACGFLLRLAMLMLP
jgi:hypothetical protein